MMMSDGFGFRCRTHGARGAHHGPVKKRLMVGEVTASRGLRTMTLERSRSPGQSTAPVPRARRQGAERPDVVGVRTLLVA